MEQFPIKKPARAPKEWKLVALRDCPVPERLALCETPAHAAEYWRTHINATP
jgi:hypothetical protein